MFTAMKENKWKIGLFSIVLIKIVILVRVTALRSKQKNTKANYF